ncbi:hypothetical protein GCK72_025469 [Caenorhabditis remanei]|uniref:Nematode Specific Peptide family, group C n=1 Tax=Caenorhabditis remanei TaxID=31234 RepID=A0A6A5G2T1_CAERE|nr:hypothetical protein GCK72_025469 [Caenorhabditis remanei]KAF1749002.1 hypothetical protein GCK72_025469 [Caenorhabditis remanei]
MFELKPTQHYETIREMNTLQTVRKIWYKKINNEGFLLRGCSHKYATGRGFFRALFSLCLVSSIGAVTLAICQNYCASVNGGASYDNCSPWISFATQTNQTCYNLCVHNCAAVYDGSCMTGNNFRCCLATTPAKTQEFKVSGCNTLYNNL